MESDLINFISSVQLRMEDDKEKSDLILHTLCLYAEGKVSRETCVFLVFSLLKSVPDLQQRFSEIVECPPPPPSRSGALISDIFINTIIEFELWPGLMEKFLKGMKSAMLGETTLIDIMCELEFYNATSGPFWLLWDVFQPISQTSDFIQLLFDGCVDTKLIPPHMKYDVTPLENDFDKSRATAENIFDSDLFCAYRSDIRNASRPIGPKRIGSYGLVVRNLVDCRLSGRKIQDFAVLNDRWASAAAGLDVIFCHVRKNQYEEKLFLNEDERVDLDVRISRYKSTLKHINDLRNKIIENPEKIFFKISEFKYNFTALDMYTLSEIYDYQNLEDLIENVAQNSIPVLAMIYERIEEKLSNLLEYRRSKESEYYDLNRKNSKKSLDVVHEVKASNVVFEDPMIRLRGGKSCVATFKGNSYELTNAVLQKSAKISTVKASTDAVNTMISFVKIILGQKPPQPAHRGLVFHAFHAMTKELKESNFYFITVDLYRLVYIYSLICEAFESVSNRMTSTHSVDTDEQARGRNIAVRLGHIQNSAIKERITPERIIDQVPQFVYGAKNSAELDEAFDLPSAKIYSFDMLRKAIQQFILVSVNAFNDELSKIVSEALAIEQRDIYVAYCLENLGNGLYVKCTKDGNETHQTFTFKAEIPRMFKVNRKVTIKAPSNIGPVMITDEMIEEEQSRLMNANKKSKQQRVKSDGIIRGTSNNLLFRVGKEGVEFKNYGSDLVMPMNEEDSSKMTDDAE